MVTYTYTYIYVIMYVYLCLMFLFLYLVLILFFNRLLITFFPSVLISPSIFSIPSFILSNIKINIHNINNIYFVNLFEYHLV